MVGCEGAVHRSAAGFCCIISRLRERCIASRLGDGATPRAAAGAAGERCGDVRRCCSGAAGTVKPWHGRFFCGSASQYCWRSSANVRQMLRAAAGVRYQGSPGFAGNERHGRRPACTSCGHARYTTARLDDPLHMRVLWLPGWSPVRPSLCQLAAAFGVHFALDSAPAARSKSSIRRCCMACLRSALALTPHWPVSDTHM